MTQPVGSTIRQNKDLIKKGKYELIAEDCYEISNSSSTMTRIVRSWAMPPGSKLKNGGAIGCIGHQNYNMGNNPDPN